MSHAMRYAGGLFLASPPQAGCRRSRLPAENFEKSRHRPWPRSVWRGRLIRLGNKRWPIWCGAHVVAVGREPTRPIGVCLVDHGASVRADAAAYSDGRFTPAFSLKVCDESMRFATGQQDVIAASPAAAPDKVNCRCRERSPNTAERRGARYMRSIVTCASPEKPSARAATGVRSMTR